MDTAKYVARVVSLRAAGPSASAPDESDLLLAGPGYRIVTLEVSQGVRTGDASLRVDAVSDFHALKNSIALELNELWGEQPPWGMQGLRLRIDRGEDIPQPWFTAAVLTDVLDVWRLDGTGGWIALGVADRDTTDEVSIVVVVTDRDPV
ncbi:hypothetical protein OG800_42485 [Streptomyces sp. NBC_00445]|uniref:hypothetical protein n=1 Tax=Streptomyces sp. NBC_00445 TaxID=2975745 RepID=UPI002E1D7396